ncbi:uncharacterized protein LOC131180630 [Hevea brasiliensis]|uniref:uncharacterized protein LOC131180630 n=1 Tax=Hevea brasiliensis TaxID=3981 RepID=UPI0025DB5F16|nr:uncharacterized protein LOC131180630 [Hevea brasiliensis]
MRLSICQKLEVRELKPTTISLQLVDRSIKYPMGILENIPIKVGKFFIPVDFVVLKMEEDVQIPIILGRPFLSTAEAIIDVKNERLTLKVGDEEVEFNLFNTMKHKFEPDECLRVDIVDKQVEEEFHKTHPEDPLEACIVHSHTVNDENTEIATCAQYLATHPLLPLAQAFKVEELKEEQTKSNLKKISEQVKLKPLPSTLRYAFLDSNSEYPVIVNASLSEIEERKLLRVLRTRNKSIGVLPPNMTYQQKKKFLHDVRYYTWEEPLLYKRCNDGLIRQCIPKEDIESILQHCHSSPYGGHFGTIKIAAKILQAGFY